LKYVIRRVLKSRVVGRQEKRIVDFDFAKVAKEMSRKSHLSQIVIII